MEYLQIIVTLFTLSSYKKCLRSKFNHLFYMKRVEIAPIAANPSTKNTRGKRHSLSNIKPASTMAISTGRVTALVNTG